MPPERGSQKGIFSIITGTASMQKTPPKKTKNIHNVPPHNTVSHQPLYSEEIFTQRVDKNWEGFNSQIKT